MSTFFRAAAVALPLTCAAHPASSTSPGEAPEESAVPQIVVRGEFRPTPLDELPASVSVIEGEALEARGARHLEEALGLAPNVNISAGASRSRFFQIRGIGERGQFIEPLNPSVGLLIDGVDLSDSAAAAALFDVEQVEVFLGPQGTRYGANALAGLINIRTRAPTDTLQGNVGVEGGRYGTYTVHGAVSGPLSETLSARLAAQHHASEGFLRNDFLGREDTNERSERALRGKLRWRPAAQTTLEGTFGYVDIENGYDAFSLDNSRTTLSDEPGRDEQKTVFGSLELRWNAHPALALVADAAAATSDSLYSYDEDWTFVGFDPAGYSSTDAYLRDRRNLSGEIKLLSREAGRLFGGSGDWVLGLYALDRVEELHREYTFLQGPFRSRFDVERVAVFGELRSALGERTTLTTGLRYESHQAHYCDSEAVTFDPSDHLLGWRLSVDRTLRPGVMVYAGIARGYKAGGFNTDGTLDEDLRQYEPETLMNYEAGVKGHFLDGRLAARLTAFYMRRDKVQIASSTTRQRSDGSSEFIEFVGNAAEGTHLGLEAQLTLQVTSALALEASLGLLDAEYRSFINAAGRDLDGREQAHAPSYQFAARARYTFGTGWYAELAGEGRDAFYYSDSHDVRSRAYTLLNAALGLQRGNWETRLAVRNLTDENYTVRGYFFGNDPRFGYEARSYTQLGVPRQYALSATWTFE